MSETDGIAQARASNQWMANGDFGFEQSPEATVTNLHLILIAT